MPRNPLQQRLISIIEPVLAGAGLELVDVRFLLEQGGWVLRVQIDVPIADVLDIHQVPPGEPSGQGVADPRFAADRPSIDRPRVPTDRVSVADCEKMSFELSAVLDVEDPISQAYQLEVSSPGIDRPLRTPGHFAHYTGSEAKIQLGVPLQMPSPLPERRNFRGILRGVSPEGDKVTIDCDGQRFDLVIADIDQAKLVPDWDAVMHGESGVGPPKPQKPIKPGHRPSQKHNRKTAD